jgi:hypothetical protein
LNLSNQRNSQQKSPSNTNGPHMPHHNSQVNFQSPKILSDEQTPIVIDGLIHTVPVQSNISFKRNNGNSISTPNRIIINTTANKPPISNQIQNLASSSGYQQQSRDFSITNRENDHGYIRNSVRSSSRPANQF